MHESRRGVGPPPSDGLRDDSPVRILLVDDDAAFAERVVGYLERDHGHFEVTTANSASGARDAFDDRAFECVVAEHDLPDRTGLELLESVREACPELPFILFTGEGSEGVASEAISTGVTDYLQKHPSEDRYALLANRVENAVSQYRAERRTERHQRLLESRAAAMEASIDGMAILDETGSYEFVNQAHADVYGFDDPAEFLGNHWRMCYGDDELARFESRVLPRLEASGGWRGEATGLRKDGSTFPQELSLSETGDGGLVCVVRDITERKRRERELERERNRLAEFADVVSHDLRNPLNVATGALSLVEEDCDSDHLATVARAHDRMEALIDDLLTLAREGQTAEEPVPVDLASVAEAAWRNVETDRAELRIADDASVLADRSRLQQLVANLVGNAVTHGRPADATTGLTVTVGRIDADEAGERGFYVADDGVGIPEGRRESVFDTGHTTRDDGTGFGLSIVAQIADAHDWSVSVTDSDRGGARFEVRGVEFA